MNARLSAAHNNLNSIREAGFASEVDNWIIHQQRFTEGGGCYGYDLFNNIS
mgnify:CR=1 FL=1